MSAPATHGRVRSVLAVPCLLTGATATAAVALVPLFRDPAAMFGTAVLAVVAAAVAGTATGTGTARVLASRPAWRRAPAPRAESWVAVATLLGGVAGGLLCAWWTAVPGTTVAGMPGPASIRALAEAWSGAVTAIGHAHAPVTATAVLRLAVASTAGLVAATAQAAWAAWHRPLPALAPAAAALVGTAALAPDRDLAAVASFVLVAAAAVWVAGHGAATAVWVAGHGAATTGGAAADGTGSGSTGGRGRPGETDGHGRSGGHGRPGGTGGRGRPGRAVRPLLTRVRGAGILAAAAAVAGVAAGTAPLAGVRMALDHHAGASSEAPGTLVVLKPTANLLPYKLRLAGTKAFTVTAPLPSYWQLTSLDTFTGSGWVSTGRVGEPPGARARTGGRGTVRLVQQVQLQGLQSPWLPAAPEPVALHGAGKARIAASGAVVADATPNRFEVTSAVTLLPAAQLRALPAPPAAAWLAPYRTLPPVPPSVVTLAHQLVAGIASPYQQALALVAHFTSGEFRYTLSPPPYPAGADPLVGFLMDTHAGYCQQFASAFAVLARLDGLPTRLAVGFSAGQPLGHDTYQVTGIDAHVWPEVYLGGTAGWVSFEPTPPAATAPATSPAPADARSATTHPAPAQATPVGVQGLAHPPVTAPTPRSDHSAARAHRASTPANGGSWAVLAAVLAAAAIAIAAGLGAAMARRRRHWSGPAGRIDRAWASATGALARRRLGPQRQETPRQYARRLAAVGGTDAGAPARHVPTAPPHRHLPAAPPHRHVPTAPPDRHMPAAPAATVGRGLAMVAADGAPRSPSRRVSGRGATASLADTARLVAELAGLVEEARYGPRPPTPAHAAHARELAVATRRACRRVPRPPRPPRRRGRGRGRRRDGQVRLPGLNDW